MLGYSYFGVCYSPVVVRPWLGGFCSSVSVGGSVLCFAPCAGGRWLGSFVPRPRLSRLAVGSSVSALRSACPFRFPPRSARWRGGVLRFRSLRRWFACRRVWLASVSSVGGRWVAPSFLAVRRAVRTAERGC